MVAVPNLEAIESLHFGALLEEPFSLVGRPGWRTVRQNFAAGEMVFAHKEATDHPCLALPCLALPCLALPCLALPCLALPLTRERAIRSAFLGVPADPPVQTPYRRLRHARRLSPHVFVVKPFPLTSGRMPTGLIPNRRRRPR